MTPEDRTIEIAVEVTTLLSSHGAKSAVIGAVALAVRGYTRATADLDLGTVTDATRVLPLIAAELTRRGYDVDLSEPDADDPLGGVLTVRSKDADTVQVVNYLNPWNGWAEVGKEAIDTAEPNALQSLAVVDVPHLVALKLYAGGRKSQLDVLELLDRHPEALESVRAVCERLRLGDELAEVMRPSSEDR
jgi:hypothetical protein